MKRNRSDGEEKCTFCGKAISSTGMEQWHDEHGNSFAVEKADTKSALADTSLGEVWMCDSCYKTQEFADLSIRDICEIHYQFGLVFLEAFEDLQALEALSSALNYGTSPDLFLALATAHRRLGHHAEAKRFEELASDKE